MPVDPHAAVWRRVKPGELKRSRPHLLSVFPRQLKRDGVSSLRQSGNGQGQYGAVCRDGLCRNLTAFAVRKRHGERSLDRLRVYSADGEVERRRKRHVAFPCRIAVAVADHRGHGVFADFAKPDVVEVGRARRAVLDPDHQRDESRIGRKTSGDSRYPLPFLARSLWPDWIYLSEVLAIFIAPVNPDARPMGAACKVLGANPCFVAIVASRLYADALRHDGTPLFGFCGEVPFHRPCAVAPLAVSDGELSAPELPRNQFPTDCKRRLKVWVFENALPIPSFHKRSGADIRRHGCHAHNSACRYKILH